MGDKGWLIGTHHLQKEILPKYLATSRHWFLIHCLLEQGNHVIAQLKKLANPNMGDKDGNIPLHLAACKGLVDVVRELLANGADPKIVDNEGNTPFMLAKANKDLAPQCYNLICTLLLGGKDVEEKVDGIL